MGVWVPIRTKGQTLEYYGIIPLRVCIYVPDLWRKSKGQRIECKVEGNANAGGYQNYQNRAVIDQLTTLKGGADCFHASRGSQ